MSSPDLRIVVAQLNLMVGDIEGNVDRIIEASEQAEKQLAANAIVFPELTLTGYPPEDLLLRPGMSRRIERALARLCEYISGDISVIFGFPHREGDDLYNAAAVVSHGKIQFITHKQNLPNYSVFDEKRYFVTGDHHQTINIKDVPVGILICEDIWFPGPFAQLADQGAQLVISLNASPFHINKWDEREAIVRERINEHAIPVVYANLVGGQDELVFDGDSFVMDNNGKLTQRMPMFEEGLYPVDISILENRCQPLAQILPPRPDSVASVYQALVTGVRDFVTKNGFKGVVIGLSGGVDSALTLAVAVDALGADEVEAVMMPSRYTADMSVEDAEEEANILKVNYQVIPIEKAFNTFLDLLSDEFAGLPVDTTEENIQARCRGLLLMAISNKKRKMVLTTGNKSEMAVGYATLYGDMAGGYDVLKDVPKTLVFRLCEYRNSLGRVIPQRVIDRPPSAELAPDQKDTDSLPPYDILDAILERYVEQDQGVESIVAAGFERDTVLRVVRMVDRNEYKRRQAAPGIRVTSRAFGRDRRYPITSAYGKDRS